ncbi:MAG: hypothetical protein IPN20_15010 [Haliscomenobacter sp.]|nr:hypothetical protein [Haliscomenobacter sp.]
MDEAFRVPDEQHHIPYLRNLLQYPLILSERILRQQSDFQSSPVGMDMDYSTAFRNLLNMHFAVEKVSVSQQRNSISPKPPLPCNAAHFGQKPSAKSSTTALCSKPLTAGQLRQTCQGNQLRTGFGEPTNLSQFFKKMVLTPGRGRTANGWNPAPKASSAP